MKAPQVPVFYETGEQVMAHTTTCLCSQFKDDLSSGPMMSPEKGYHLTVTVAGQDTLQEWNQKILFPT